LIWFIVRKAKEHKIEIPLAKNIYNKIKKMEKNSPL
jgi:ketopantoate reductase